MTCCYDLWCDPCSFGGMKKRTPWIIASTVLTLLVVRVGYRHVEALKEEKAWYISQLHYECSATIDSVIRPGRALLSVTNGVMDADREWKLKEKLNAYGMLHLAIRRDSLYDLRVPNEAMANDSVYISSDHDQLLVYRNGELLITRPLSAFLRAKPF
jgi:hypothetical protein